MQISQSFVVGGVQLHLYGFILGCAVVIALRVAEKILVDLGWSETRVFRLALVLLAVGIVGARLWHVATDDWLYRGAFMQVGALWQGGLSILGAVVAGIIALLFLVPVKAQRDQVVDALAFALPVGQAIGRLGNWVNNELYGLPTNVPWGLFVAPEYRFVQFAKATHYHPLFAYEAVCMLLFLGLLVLLRNKQLVRKLSLQPLKNWVGEIGTGRYFMLYYLYYATVRFSLDFLRIEKTVVWMGLGFNQVFLLGVMLIVLGDSMSRKYTKRKTHAVT